MPFQKGDEGHSKASIAKTLNVSRRLVNERISKYLSNSFNGLALKVAPPYLMTDKKIH